MVHWRAGYCISCSFLLLSALRRKPVFRECGFFCFADGFLPPLHSRKQVRIPNRNLRCNTKSSNSPRPRTSATIHPRLAIICATPAPSQMCRVFSPPFSFKNAREVQEGTSWSPRVQRGSRQSLFGAVPRRHINFRKKLPKELFSSFHAEGVYFPLTYPVSKSAVP